MEEKNKNGSKDPGTIKKKLNKYKVSRKKGKTIPKNKKKSGPAKKPSSRVNKNVGISAKNPISINQPKVPGGFQMKMGSKEINSPSAFSMKQSAMMMHIPGDPKKGHDPKKGNATMSTGKQGGFVQRSQGPVTGGVVNTLDEVIMTVPKNKKPPKKKKKPRKPFRRTDVGRALGDIGDAIGGIFKKKHKTKFGRRGIVRGGVKPRGAKRYQRKVRRR